LLGLGGAAIGARLLSALLFDVSPRDPLVYLVAAGALFAVGVVATLVPALRVLRTDPTVALRAE
jgi:putative ABC transport system permease protein